MPALIDLRRRVKSVRNTQQITQAMKTVATAKFRKAHKSVLEGRAFWHAMPELIAEINRFLPSDAHPLLERRMEKMAHAVVLTSDKGLAGAFNSNLLERAREFLDGKAGETRIRLFIAGKKGKDFFRHSDYQADWISEKNLDDFGDRDLKMLGEDLMRRYALHQTDAVYLIYNEFKSILAPQIAISKILPVEAEEMAKICRPRKKDQPAGRDSTSGEAEEACREEAEELVPDWNPPPPDILRTLIPLYVRDQLRHAFHESSAAEQAARMMAMDNASKNAEELIDNLTLQLNKIRQSMITTELLEIMTAVEALAKK